jgi:hypothetical protein
MKEIKVNQIDIDRGVTHGIIVTPDLIAKALKLIFGEEKMTNILILPRVMPDGFHLIEKFHQYVVYVEYRPPIGFSIKVSDFGNNINNVLDEFLELEAKNWESEDITKYVRLVDEIIQEGYKQEATMVQVYA